MNIQALTDFFTNMSYGLIIRVLIIIAVGIVSILLIRIVLMQTFFKKTNKQSRMLVNRLVSYIGFAIILIVVLSELGINLTAILGAAGVLGIAIGVASQKSLGNIISGFFMVTEKSFEIGDVITVGDKTGIVHSVELLSIKLKTFDNLIIRIPNESLISSDVINITKFPIRRMDINITLSYNTDVDIAMQTLKDIAEKNPFCLDEPEVLLLIKDFCDSGILLKFGVWFDKNTYIETHNSVMADIIQQFREKNIRIPYPQLTLSYDERLNSKL